MRGPIFRSLRHFQRSNGTLGRSGPLVGGFPSSFFGPRGSISTPHTASKIAPLFSSSSLSINYHPHSRFFASSTTSKDLAVILERELEEENSANSGDMPEELRELRQSLEENNGWKIVEEGASTKMIRTTPSGSKVQLSFHSQDSVDFDDSVDFKDEAEEDEEGFEPDPSFRFTVTATKAGKSFVFGCISEHAMIVIQTAAVTTEDVDAIQHNSGIDTSLYQGPEFSELAEDLQEAFHEYLEEDLGITADVAAFVAMQADFQEQNNYMKFLEDAKSLL